MNINELPEEIQELARFARKMERNKHNFHSEEDLTYMFMWEETPQGHNWWSNIDNNWSKQNKEKYIKEAKEALLKAGVAYQEEFIEHLISN